MRITAITLENFKGIREPVRVELKPITLLFGPNSAGKSTILQALHYAREILEHQNLNPDRTSLGGSSIDLGGFESLVHQHDLGRAIKIKLEFFLDDGVLPEFYEEQMEFTVHPVVAENVWLELTIEGYLLNLLKLQSKTYKRVYNPVLIDKFVFHPNCIRCWQLLYHPAQFCKL